MRRKETLGIIPLPNVEVNNITTPSNTATENSTN